LRTRCATASTRASAAVAAWVALALAVCAAFAAVERGERALVERDRLAVLPLLLVLALLRVARGLVAALPLPPLRLLALLRVARGLVVPLPLLPLPLPLALLRREPLARLPLEREDELPELEPLLLAWGILLSPSWDKCRDDRQATHL
jgi:hypothetical protein